jgi:hypothetical protein
VEERIASINAQWPAMNEEERKESIRATIRESFAAMQANWDNLYDCDKHFDLRAAIIAQLKENEANRKKNKN